MSNTKMCFTLANNETWNISTSDQRFGAALATVAAAMQLGPQTAPRAGQKTVNVVIRASEIAGDRNHESAAQDWSVCAPAREDDIVLQLVRLSARFAAGAIERGGLLLHGALAERAGRGVIFAGPGGRGKSTTSGRLPLPWRTRSDDLALVVRDSDGAYWAHPWPTWSRFFAGGNGEIWDVERAVPLATILFLEQGSTDALKPIGRGEATCLGLEVAEQAAMHHLLTDAGLDQKRLRLQRLAAVEALVKHVPCHVLQLSLTGSFWTLIEAALDAQTRGAR